MYPTNHQEHETLELTQGINDWSEVGFYVFTSEQDGHGVQWVGDHIRPRIRVPDSWDWPVGVSLSTEIGYQRAVYSPDTWTWEIRPIIDKAIGRWYFAVNPALERTLHGPDVNQGLAFAPGVKISYDFTRVVSAASSTTPTTVRIGDSSPRTTSSSSCSSSPTSMSRPFGRSISAWVSGHRHDRPLDRQVHPRPPLRLGPSLPGRLTAVTRTAHLLRGCACFSAAPAATAR